MDRTLQWARVKARAHSAVELFDLLVAATRDGESELRDQYTLALGERIVKEGRNADQVD